MDPIPSHKLQLVKQTRKHFLFTNSEPRLQASLKKINTKTLGYCSSPILQSFLDHFKADTLFQKPSGQCWSVVEIADCMSQGVDFDSCDEGLHNRLLQIRSRILLEFMLSYQAVLSLQKVTMISFVFHQRITVLP